MWNCITKKIFCYRIMIDILFVHALSRTPLFLIHLLLLILGLSTGEAGEEATLFNFYCMIFISYINGTSLFLCTVFTPKKMRKRVEPIITPSCLERFLPSKGFYIRLILTFSLCNIALLTNL